MGNAVLPPEKIAAWRALKNRRVPLNGRSLKS